MRVVAGIMVFFDGMGVVREGMLVGWFLAAINIRRLLVGDGPGAR
jgi:Na+/melibiose symporter-like transporter